MGMCTAGLKIIPKPLFLDRLALGRRARGALGFCKHCKDQFECYLNERKISLWDDAITDSCCKFAS
jgi:hypothetical protein